MDNEYSDYQEEEKTNKFQIKRWMILVGIAVLILIIIIIVSIVIHNKNKELLITESKCRELEERMRDEAPIYIDNNSMDLSEEKTRIDFQELLDTNGGNIIADKIPQLDLIDGYVEAYIVDDSRSYEAYIMCGDVYKTPGYKEKETVEDEKPVIKLKGKKSVTIYVGDKYDDEGATASDKEDGDLTDKISVKNNVDSSKSGKYSVTYTVEDSFGNKVTKKREVVVKEKETTTTKTTTSTISSTTKTTTTRKASSATTKKSTYTTSRKITTTTKKITTPPTITLNSINGSINVTMYVGDSYSEPGFSARDALGTIITSRVTTTYNINNQVAGTYYVTYSVKDSYGNSATARRTVYVKSKGTISGITLSPTSLSLKKGSKGKFSAMISSTGEVDKTLSWSSSNNSVASVSSSGEVSANAPGSAYITATTKNGKSARGLVIVSN